MIRVWHSTDDFGDYIINNTCLKNLNIKKSKIYESDANNPANFHSMPDHIKKILYLDAPDLILEHNNEPICSIEVPQEVYIKWIRRKSPFLISRIKECFL
jgi:hypothetical protein